MPSVHRVVYHLLRSLSLCLIAPPPSPLSQALWHIPMRPNAKKLLGRDQELAHIVQRAAEHRFVEIRGGPGEGKTELALRAAQQLLQEWKSKGEAGGAVMLDCAGGCAGPLRCAPLWMFGCPTDNEPQPCTRHLSTMVGYCSPGCYRSDDACQHCEYSDTQCCEC
jgi:hypothetical protein